MLFWKVSNKHFDLPSLSPPHHMYAPHYIHSLYLIILVICGLKSLVIIQQPGSQVWSIVMFWPGQSFKNWPIPRKIRLLFKRERERDLKKRESGSWLGHAGPPVLGAEGQAYHPGGHMCSSSWGYPARPNVTCLVCSSQVLHLPGAWICDIWPTWLSKWWYN